MRTVAEASVRGTTERLLETDSARREAVEERPVICLTSLFRAKGNVVRRVRAILCADRLATLLPTRQARCPRSLLKTD